MDEDGLDGVYCVSEEAILYPGKRNHSFFLEESVH